jgi:putative oxidoreductase
MKPLFLIGRIIFGGYFIYNGINHIRNLEPMSQYAGSKKVPMPKAAVAASGGLILAGGASVLLGVKPKYGAAALIGFLAAVSPTMHDFWSVEDPGQRMMQTINFTKNMALLGAALALMSVEEPWPASVAHERPTVMERVKDAVNALAA